jgi:signal transduction histidine kinase
VYRHPLAIPGGDAAAAVAAESRGHIDAGAAARAIAGAIAAQTGASSVAIVAGGIVVAVHKNGHDLMPLSPSAAAAVQGDPAVTRLLPLGSDALPTPASLIVVGADPGAELETLAHIAALGIDLAAMMETARHADRLGRLKDEFVAHVSHELRAPLTTIVGALQTLERVEAGGPKAIALRSSAMESASRLRRLVEDLLMATRLGGRTVPARLAPTRINLVVEQAVAEVPGSDDVQITVQQPLPEIPTDHEHLRRILMNLVDNAVRHGGAPVTIDVAASGSGVLVRVTDHGDGLPPLVARAPFAGEYPSATGLGVGLRIAAGLAEALGAKLTHRPVAGGGAAFELLLPDPTPPGVGN